MSSTELSAGDKKRLLGVAEWAIRSALREGRCPTVEPGRFPEIMQKNRASFVTLKHDGELRGCIGSLEAYRPMVADVTENACAAAFRDPRFPPLCAAELEGLTIEISLLTLPEPVSFDSEEELIAKLEPGRDGLILREGWRRGTFLPAVWESLPKAREFLAHLKLKAGLAPDYWSDSIEIERYRTESFGQRIPLQEHDAGDRSGLA
jgi:AmmeMemoRadiSam system protein A